MLTKEQRLRRATIAVVARLHHEAPAETLEERAGAIEHWRGQPDQTFSVSNGSPGRRKTEPLRGDDAGMMHDGGHACALPA